MPYFKSENNCRIFYDLLGTDSAKSFIILINGTIQTTQNWRTVSADLENHFNVLLYDIRGQGKSKANNKDFSLQIHTQDLIALVDYLGITSAQLIGVSHGARIALEMAAQYPHRVKKIVLCSIGADFSTRIKTILNAWKRILKKDDLKTMIWALVPIVFGEKFLKQNDSILEGIVTAIYKRNKKSALIRHFEAMQNYPSLLESAKKVRTPALVLSASDDLLVSFKDAEKLSLLLDCQHIHVDDSGHSIPFEHPELFTQTVVSFLNDTTIS